MESEGVNNKRPLDTEAVSAINQTTTALGSFGVIIFFVVLAQVVLMIGLNVYQRSRLEDVNARIGEQRQILAQTGNSTINNQISSVIAGEKNLSLALNSRIKWSVFYLQLNSITPKNVKFNNVSLTESGSFKAEGQTDSFASLAKALVAWQGGTATIATPFTSVELGGNGYAVEGNQRKVTFSISGNIATGGLK